MDDPKCGQTIGRVRYGHRYQGLGVICIDCGEREVKPGGLELVATVPRQILGITTYKEAILIDDDKPEIGVERYVEHVIVATSDGVFERAIDGVFREVQFERIGT